MHVPPRQDRCFLIGFVFGTALIILLLAAGRADLPSALSMRAQEHPPGGLLQLNNVQALDRAIRDYYPAPQMPAAWRKHSSDRRRSPVYKGWKRQDSMFVSIASFRDAECSRTVRHLFATAAYPRRIFIGAVEQNAPGDVGMQCTPQEYATLDPCLSCVAAEDCFCPSDNIRVRRIDASKAKGPTFGRYVASLLYRGEAYYMSIDSHMRGTPKWDERLIRMYRDIPSPRAVISNYPSGYDDENGIENHTYVIVMCNARFFDHLGYLQMVGQAMPPSVVPRQQPFSAAGFLFADAELLQDVPFDPYLDYLFDGEEILFTARMWTHGWDLYAPAQTVLHHYYVRAKGPRLYTNERKAEWGPSMTRSIQRVRLLLQSKEKTTGKPLVTYDTVQQSNWPADEKKRVLAELQRYGLGQRRSLDEYYTFAGVDPVGYNTTGDHECDRVRSSSNTQPST